MNPVARQGWAVDDVTLKIHKQQLNLRHIHLRYRHTTDNTHQHGTTTSILRVSGIGL
jgi:hypothetical protein